MALDNFPLAGADGLFHGGQEFFRRPISRVGGSKQDAATSEQVVRDCYAGEAGTSRIADICRATVRICQSAGVLDVPGAVDAFAAYKLLPQR